MQGIGHQQLHVLHCEESVSPNLRWKVPAGHAWQDETVVMASVGLNFPGLHILQLPLSFCAESKCQVPGGHGMQIPLEVV